MKKTTTLFLFMLSLATSFGQAPYFNEWFAKDPDRPFVKLLVSADAVYEVTAGDLLAAGHDLSQAQPDSIQMYYRGEEIPLTVEEDGQGRFASLTFYGRRNDGGVEAQMYRHPINGMPDPSQQPNPNFSIYSDTSAYFLTWGRTLGKRYITAIDTNYSNYTPEASYPYESIWEPHPDSATSTDQQAIAVIGGGGIYDSFHSLNSNFITGEGYISKASFKNQQPFITSFLQTPNPLLSSQDVRFQLRIFHRSNTEHHPRVTLANSASTVVLDTSFSYNLIAVRTYTRSIQVQLSSHTDLRFDALRSPYDDNHLTFIRIRYERLPDLINQATTRISEWPRNTLTYFRFANALGQNKVWAYDPTNEIRYEGQISGGDAHVVLSGRFYGKNVEVVTDQGFRKPLILSQTKLRNLCDPDSGASFILIAHRDLATSAEAYASYRNTTHVENKLLSAKVIYIDEIYEEFSYGAPTPQAIQQFLNCAQDNWNTPPAYIFLWGEGKIWLRGNDSTAIVPTYGFPANDIRFSAPWNEDMTAQIPLGRLNISSDIDGINYLNKVIEFEKTGDEPWRRKGLFLGGGRTPGEQNAINNALKYAETCFLDSSGIQKSSISFQLGIDSVVTYHDSIDAGLGMIYYFGSSSYDSIQVEFKHPSEYQNNGRYPFLTFFGAFMGDFVYAGNTLGDSWIKEDGKGAIACLSISSAGYLNPQRDYGRIFFCQEFNTLYNRPIGEIMRRTYQKMIDSLPGIQYVNHARQMTLQGDPALVIFPFGMNTGIPPQPETSVQIFPNPAHDELTISSADELIEALSLYNLLGQQILEKTDLFKNELQLDVSSLTPGHYFLRYKTQNGGGVEKIIIH